MTKAGAAVEKRSRAATRERLLDGALQVFAEIGFEAASVEDICTRAGFTRGAFYSSFRSKGELFLALIQRHTERMVIEVSAAMVGFEQAPDPLATAVERYLRLATLDRTWLLVKAEFTLYAMRHPEAARAHAQQSEWIESQLAHLLDQLFTACGCTLLIDAADLARILVVLHVGSVTDALLNPSSSTLVDVERQILPILLRAISVDKVVPDGVPPDRAGPENVTPDSS